MFKLAWLRNYAVSNCFDRGKSTINIYVILTFV